METHLFFTRDQRQGETVDSYITDLKHKAKTCEFGDIKDGLIRDRFISSVTSEQLHRVLLKEKSLTLQRTIEITQLDEITQARLKQFKSDKEIHSFTNTSTQQYQKGKPGRPTCEVKLKFKVLKHLGCYTAPIKFINTLTKQYTQTSTKI